MQMDNKGNSRLVVDYDIGDAANININANSRAASSWPLGCDEALRRAQAARQHTTSTISLLFA